MSDANQVMGERGERVAEKWLKSRGWTILQRRFRNGHRDIDLVASRAQSGSPGREIAFVEVKARASADFGGPLSAVGWGKRRELCRSATVWISRFQQPNDTFRFDVVGVLFERGRVQVRHVENAFEARTRS